MTTATTPTTRRGGPSAPPDPRISGAFVRIMIGVMIVLALGMVCLVFYRSESFVEPTAAAVVVGDQSLDGTEIAVMANGRQVVGATLNAQNRYATPLLLQPGVYQLQATHNGEELLSRTVGVANLTYVTVDLPTSVTVEGDVSLDGAKVELTDAQWRNSTAVLSRQNDFAAILYRLPGRYHLTVTYNGRVLRDEQIVVALHQSRRIALLPGVDPERDSAQGQ
jgi:hypothetical protein